MAFEERGIDITCVAGADLSAANNQYRAVKLNGARQVVLAALGDAAIGILQNTPANTDAAHVRVAGVSKMRAGAAVAVPGGTPTLLKSDANGRIIAAALGTVNTSDAGAVGDPVIGSNVIGQGLTAAAALDEIFTGLVQPIGISPTTNA